jgi:uncharacterized protein YbdZ (MbtH family)
MVSMPSRRRVLVPFLLCAASHPGWAVYGETETVSAGSPVPPGWVVCSRSGRGSGGGPGGCKVIKDLKGAPYGAIEGVLPGSRIPKGWVVTGYAGHGMHLMYIKCLVRPLVPEPGPGPQGILQRETILIHSPIPEGWRLVQEGREDPEGHVEIEWTGAGPR